MVVAEDEEEAASMPPHVRVKDCTGEYHYETFTKWDERDKRLDDVLHRLRTKT